MIARAGLRLATTAQRGRSSRIGARSTISGLGRGDPGLGCGGWSPSLRASSPNSVLPAGVPLIATLGAPGLLTRWMSSLGFNPWNHGFSRYTFFGVALVYTYFQLPLMVLVHHPRSRGAAPDVAKGGVRARGQQLALLALLRSPSHLPLRLAMVDNGRWCLATGRLRPAKKRRHSTEFDRMPG